MSVKLKSFPFDSMEVLNSNSGQMEDDRLYNAKIFRDFFAKFLSNGVYYGHYKNYGENSMKVVLDSGLTVKIKKGSGNINGADFELENDTLITLDRPASGNRKDRVVVKVDDTLAVRETQLYVKQGNGTTPAALQRDSNIYEICIAEITVKSSSNLTAADIVDKRLDSDLCGIVNSLISVDGTELLQNFQNYIDTVTANLVRKDQAAVVQSITDAQGRGLSENDFTDAYKTKIDGIATGANKTTVNNTLTSDSTTEALSAAMGKKLNEDKQNKISIGTAVPTTLAEGAIYLQYFN